MGQYYRTVYGDSEGHLINVFDLTIENLPEELEEYKYTGYKLMEHSYWDVIYTNSVSNLLFNNPSRIVWLGDYADDEDLQYLKKLSSAKEIFSYRQVWEEFCSGWVSSVEYADFSLNDKYLINHDKKLYLDCNKYFKESKSFVSKGYNFVIHPLPLLTAVGNGRGSGDFDTYAKQGMEYVGLWAWDLIEIREDIPEGYKEVNYRFVEDY